MARKKEDWQVEQAREAIRLYEYYLKEGERKPASKYTGNKDEWQKLSSETSRLMRLKHRSLSTERSYLGWLKKFYYFTGGKKIRNLDSKDIKDFLSHLAVDGNVSASTQNQAFNALLFVFRHVLEKEFDDLRGSIRAQKKRKLPVVLSRQEVKRLLASLDGTSQLIARLIYGCGLRPSQI